MHYVMRARLPFIFRQRRQPELPRAPRAPSPPAIAFAGLTALAVAMGIGRFALTPILPMMQQDAALSLAAASWLASANYLGFLLVGDPPAGSAHHRDSLGPLHDRSLDAWDGFHQPIRDLDGSARVGRGGQRLDASVRLGLVLG